MAIIYSFPEGTPTLSDTVLGTQFDNNGNPTKSFSISDIIALAPSTAGFVPYTGATQSVDLGAFDLTSTSIIKAGGTSVQYLMADGSTSTAPSLTGFVPYVGATQNVNLGSFNLTATSIVKAGGTNLQFLMADGSVTTGGGGVTSVTGTSPIISSGGTTPAISIPLGTSSVDGYLSATDRTNFETAYTNRITSLTTTGTGAATLVANVLNIPTPSLSGFVPYTGATGAVNLGAFNLTVNSISVGKGAGTGTANTAIGNLALSSATIADFNTAVGYQASKNNISGNSLTAIGYNALSSNTTGTLNTAVGYAALAGNTTGSSNVGIGGATLGANTTGIGNVGIGESTLFSNSTTNFNIAIGAAALNGPGNDSTIGIGFGAGTNSPAGFNASSSNSIFIGHQTQPSGNAQTNQIVIGYQAIGAGSNTVTLGNPSITTTRLRGAVQGGSFVKDGGTNLQYLMADGSVSTAAGITSLNGLTTSTQTFATGTTGTNFNINSVGSTHTFNLPDASITVRGVVTIGGQSFSGLKNFTDNIIVNGININKGSNNGTNIAIGAEALDNTIGNQNTVIGFQAASNNDVVSLATSFNTVLGYQAYSNGQANNNTAIGWQSLFSSAANNNSALGYSSGLLITTGFQNTFIGAFAGGFAGQKIDAANSTAIGYQTITTKNNQVVLGNSSVTETVIRGTTLVDGGVFNAVDSLIVGGPTKSTQYKLSALNTAPASATAAGTLGEIRVTAAFIYVCIATNTWVRAALTTW